MPTTKEKTSILFRGHLLYVDGFYTTATNGDEITAPTPAEIEITSIWCGDADIHEFLVDIGYDCKEIEEVVLNKLKNQQ